MGQGRTSTRNVVMAIAVGLALGGWAIGGACDSNPTPHPAYQGDDATVADTAGGGTGDPGFVDESDPEGKSDTTSPAAAVDAGDSDADDNETSDADSETSDADSETSDADSETSDANSETSDANSEASEGEVGPQ